MPHKRIKRKLKKFGRSAKLVGKVFATIAKRPFTRKDLRKRGLIRKRKKK